MGEKITADSQHESKLMRRVVVNQLIVLRSQFYMTAGIAHTSIIL